MYTGRTCGHEGAGSSAKPEIRSRYFLLLIEISCRAVHKLVSEYVDGDLGADLRHRLEDHFRVCRHCTAILDGTRNVVRLAMGGRVFDLPPGFSDRLLTKLREADPPSWKSPEF